MRIVHWREWCALPDLGIDQIKAKLDTGARTSSLHACNIQEKWVNGAPFVEFTVHPLQRSTEIEVLCFCPIIDRRRVTSSNGHAETRPVIATTLYLRGEEWQIELTVNNRENMGFRLLLGRQALRGRVLVDTCKESVL